AGEINKHKFYAMFICSSLDLPKAMSGGGIDAGYQAEIKNQEETFGFVCKQSLDMLIELVSGAKEKITLQANPLDFSTSLVKHRQIRRAAIKRAAIVGPIEAKLDRIHTACIESEGSATDH